MAGRISLKELAEQENADQEQDSSPPPPPPAPAERMRRQPTTPDTDSGSGQGADCASPHVADSDPGPKWTRLERKAVLLWPEQITRLAEVRRRLQNRKRASGRAGRERITDATLIRAALSVLLEHHEELDGADEEELTDSLRTALRQSRST